MLVGSFLGFQIIWELGRYRESGFWRKFLDGSDPVLSTDERVRQVREWRARGRVAWAFDSDDEVCAYVLRREVLRDMSNSEYDSIYAAVIQRGIPDAARVLDAGSGPLATGYVYSNSKLERFCLNFQLIEKFFQLF